MIKPLSRAKGIKMSGFIQFFIEEMGKEVVELTCAGMVNILKYVPEVQRVDETSYPLALIPDELKTQKCEISVLECPWDLEFVPDGFKTKRMCKCVKTIEDNPWSLVYVPDHFKTEEMFEKAVEDELEALEYVLDHFKTKGMCERASCIDPCNLEFVRDRFKTQKICDKTMKGDPYSLLFVPDWFMTQKQLKIWHNELIKWYNCFKKRKAQKVSIKEELMPMASHPSRWWSWCVPQDENTKTEKL